MNENEKKINVDEFDESEINEIKFDEAEFEEIEIDEIEFSDDETEVAGEKEDVAECAPPKKKKKKIILASILIAVAVLLVVLGMKFLGSIEAPNVSNDVVPAISENSDIVRNGDEEEKNMLDDKFTILVAGTDKVSGSTDIIMLATFDIGDKKMNLLSIPRDTIVNVRRKIKKINAAYANAGKDILALYDEVESVTGIRPNHYVLVTVDGFVDLVDAIGGVEVDVPINMHYDDPTQGLKIHINKGLQTLDGYDAMGFMRYRATYAEGDIGRIKVQHTFVNALMDKLMRPETVLKIPELAGIIDENITTDLTLGNEVWIGKEIMNMNLETDIKMHTLPGYPEYYDKLSYYFPKADEVLELVNEFYNPYDEPITKLNLFKK